MKNQIATVGGFHALSPEAKIDHRKNIAARAKAVLRQFWFDQNTPAEDQVLELEGWADVLEDASEGEFRRAWAQYQRTGPRSKAGRLAKPDAGAIWSLVAKARPKPKLAAAQPEPDPVKNLPSAERRLQIIQEAGLNQAAVALLSLATGRDEGVSGGAQ